MPYLQSLTNLLMLGEGVKPGLRQSDAGASWHASNVMSWTHVVASFVTIFVLSHSLISEIGNHCGSRLPTWRSNRRQFVSDRDVSSCVIVVFISVAGPLKIGQPFQFKQTVQRCRRGSALQHLEFRVCRERTDLCLIPVCKYFEESEGERSKLCAFSFVA